MPSIVLANADRDALIDDQRELLDSQIANPFPDVEVRALRSRGSAPLSSMQNDGLLVIYANSPCKWAVRAAALMSDRDWEWNNSPVIILIRKWPKKYRNQFLSELPLRAPVYELKRSRPPEWLSQVKVTPLLFLVGQDMRLIDWSMKVPGESPPEEVFMTSRLGSRLLAQPPN